MLRSGRCWGWQQVSVRLVTRYWAPPLLHPLSQASSIPQTFLEGLLPRDQWEFSDDFPIPRLLPEHPTFSPKFWLLLSCLIGLSLSAPFENIYVGLWGFNSSLTCIAIGGMFMALTWQTHLLALACGEYPVHLGHGCLWLWDQHQGQTVRKDCVRN